MKGRKHIWRTLEKHYELQLHYRGCVLKQQTDEGHKMRHMNMYRNRKEEMTVESTCGRLRTS